MTKKLSNIPSSSKHIHLTIMLSSILLYVRSQKLEIKLIGLARPDKDLSTKQELAQ